MTASRLLDPLEVRIEVLLGNHSVAAHTEGAIVTRFAVASLLDLLPVHRAPVLAMRPWTQGVAVGAPLLGPLVAAVALRSGRLLGVHDQPVRCAMIVGRGLARVARRARRLRGVAVVALQAVLHRWKVIARGVALVHEVVVALDAVHLENVDVRPVRDLQVALGRDAPQVVVAFETRLVARSRELARDSRRRQQRIVELAGHAGAIRRSRKQAGRNVALLAPHLGVC